MFFIKSLFFVFLFIFLIFNFSIKTLPRLHNGIPPHGADYGCVRRVLMNNFTALACPCSSFASFLFAIAMV